MMRKQYKIYLFIIMIVVAALPAFETRRNALGGALLGFAIVSKIFPGLLLAFLVLQRKWRAASWTVGWTLVYCVIAFAVVGPKPFTAFIEYQMPRLASGEAFWFATEYIDFGFAAAMARLADNVLMRLGRYPTRSIVGPQAP